VNKTILGVLACALFLAASAVRAQDEGGPQGPEPQSGPAPMDMGMPKDHPMTSPQFLDMLQKRLELTAEQKTKVQQAIAGSKAGIKNKFDEAIRVRKEMVALEQALWTKIGGAGLTDEQKKKVEKMERMRPGRPMMRGQQGGMGQDGREGGMGQGRKGRGRRRPGGQGGMDEGGGQPDQPQHQEGSAGE
jgi:hypothetical protein